jgi:hypothetical protein
MNEGGRDRNRNGRPEAGQLTCRDERDFAASRLIPKIHMPPATDRCHPLRTRQVAVCTMNGWHKNTSPAEPVACATGRHNAEGRQNPASARSPVRAARTRRSSDLNPARRTQRNHGQAPQRPAQGGGRAGYGAGAGSRDSSGIRRPAVWAAELLAHLPLMARPSSRTATPQHRSRRRSAMPRDWPLRSPTGSAHAGPRA